MFETGPSYIELQQTMHEALRSQHPEWVDPNGNSPICDDYEARFANLLHLFAERAEHRGKTRSFTWLG